MIPSFLEGQWRESGDSEEDVLDKYTGQLNGRVVVTGQQDLSRAARALAAAQEQQRLTPFRRYEILSLAAEMLAVRADQFVASIMLDTGFPRGDAVAETERAVDTLQLSASEARRLTGDMVPLDAAPQAPRAWGFTLRVPIGVVCAITPFNSPLNVLLHKVAPAIAAGNAVMIKPSLHTPRTANLIVGLLIEAGLPPELIAVAHGPGSTVGTWLLEDKVFGFYAFTGSTEVGRIIRRTIGVRRAQLELGSISSTIVCEDADIEHAAAGCVGSAFRKAGQVCTSLQRLYVHAGVEADLIDLITGLLDKRVVGDPAATATDIGPLINEASASRVDAWIDEAVSEGAHKVYGGGREGRVVMPSVLTQVAPQMKVMSQELFGPAVMIRPFTALADAIDEVNDTPFGLSAGIFTSNIGTAMDAAEKIRMGSVHINASSSNRSDLMPFGGVKDSGEGHEGPAYAVREMTEQRLITIGRP
ncbi:aldehyde dehydrogenase family protein [Glaciibacter superstes]|uniref:aldehyde dehydrogenase family protein n=1 Tax=Glaciibacter superstes TaxID=501023 RepID=UPI00047A539F|nr:aldehyde dehydrogenase family protein [Glaciibacter superstes]